MKVTKKNRQLAVYVWMALYGSLKCEKLNKIELGASSVVYLHGLMIGGRKGSAEKVKLLCVYDSATMNGVVKQVDARGIIVDDEIKRLKSWDDFLASVKSISIVA